MTDCFRLPETFMGLIVNIELITLIITFGPISQEKLSADLNIFRRNLFGYKVSIECNLCDTFGPSFPQLKHLQLHPHRHTYECIIITCFPKGLSIDFAVSLHYIECDVTQRDGKSVYEP